MSVVNREGSLIQGNQESESVDVLRDTARFNSVAQEIWRMGKFKPQHVAVVTHCRRVTFGELIAEASRLSQTLGGGSERGGVVAVATNSALHMVISALAAWRAGYAYLPIDPSAPEKRTRHMLSETGTRVVITDSEDLAGVPSGSWECVPFTDCRSSQPQGRKINLDDKEWETHPNGLAYVIYTSGSTGEPKGVAVTHANLRQLSDWHRNAFTLTPEDKGAQFAALTFDASVLEIWPLLAAGASLHIAERSIAFVPIQLKDFLLSHEITICFAVTPVAEQLISLDWPSETRLRFLLTGADKLRTYARPGLPFQVINNYGPTECTVLATSGTVPVRSADAGEPNIGSPIPGTEVYVLDSQLERVAEGECGQLGIAGGSVSAGYINRPDLTEERFVKRPWSPDSRVYLTGDLGRKLPTGEFEFCGRLDDQIKIRGYRIEPGEIVSVLRSHPAVAATAVKSMTINDDVQLVAYVALRSDLRPSDLRAYLLDRLPTYMIPDYFVGLAGFPITASGKVDMAALPEPNEANSLDSGGSLAELESEIQVQVAGILSHLLGGREISVHENFFRMGGHSLLAAQVIARIRNLFSIDLPLRTVFESPTVAGLSSRIGMRVVESLVSAPTGSEPADRTS